MKVVVVGGGVMGLSCAWRMAARGAEVELLEMRQCGGGATLAALGALWPASPLAAGPLQEMHRASLWGFEAFVGELAAAGGVAAPFERLGRLELLDSGKLVARAREEAEAACRLWPAIGRAGQPVMEVVGDAREVQAGLAGEVAALRCGVTGQVDVARLVAGLVAACRKAGVVIREQVAVEGLLMEGGRAAGVRVRGDAVEADGVLVTAGAWTPRVAPVLAERAAIRPAKGQGLALRRPAGVELKQIVKLHKTYLIPWGEEILVGSTTEPEAGFDEAPTAAGREQLLIGAAAIMPGLAGAEVLRHWAGLRPAGPGKGHPPVMGAVPGVGGLWVCGGHYKTGIGMAPRVSGLMADAVLEGKVAGELGAFVPRGRG